MAEIDPYAACPCGSGQKFKWCCQKVEAYASKAERLRENGQIDAALEALDEGLRKEPDNPWLATRKALILFRQDKPAAAKPILERVIAKMPGHVGAYALLIQVTARLDGAEAAATVLQRAFLISPISQSGLMAMMTHVIAMMLGERNIVPAALQHERLVRENTPVEQYDPRLNDEILADPAIAPWLKESYELSPAPAGLSANAQERFDQALKDAEQGRWAGAADSFDKLAGEGVVVAERNAGLCRLWFADVAGASTRLRRYIAKVGPTAEAVELELLHQSIAPASAEDLIEVVDLIWPLRDREKLLKTLRDRRDVGDLGVEEPDEAHPEVPRFDLFVLLDREHDPAKPVESLDDIARVVARIRVGNEIAMLEAADGGGLDALADRFREIAGPSVPPAHPKTKLLAKIPRHLEAMRAEWYIPAQIDPAKAEQFRRDDTDRLLREVWVNTPMPWLNGRTPAKAAKAGDAETQLRAALLRLDWERRLEETTATLDIRRNLTIPPEPEFDPNAVDVESLPLVRLSLLPIDRLDDDRLATLFRRARERGLIATMRRAALELLKRPALMERGVVKHVEVYSILAGLAMMREDKQEAYSWIERGRREEPASERGKNSARWDMLEIRSKAQFEPPEAWVPQLAVVLDTHAKDPARNEVVIVGLLEMGLIQIQPHPDQPGKMLLDSRGLQALLQEYGPRITTAEGTLGVSAAKQGIWTPGGSSSTPSGGGGLWTPGSQTASNAPAGEKPKLFIPR